MRVYNIHIAIIAIRRKMLCKLSTTFPIALYVIYKLEKKSLKIPGAIIRNAANLRKMLEFHNTKTSMFTVSKFLVFGQLQNLNSLIFLIDRLW